MFASEMFEAAAELIFGRILGLKKWSFTDNATFMTEDEYFFTCLLEQKLSKEELSQINLKETVKLMIEEELTSIWRMNIRDRNIEYEKFNPEPFFRTEENINDEEPQKPSEIKELERKISELEMKIVVLEALTTSKVLSRDIEQEGLDITTVTLIERESETSEETDPQSNRKKIKKIIEIRKLSKKFVKHVIPKLSKKRSKKIHIAKDNKLQAAPKVQKYRHTLKQARF